ncbi:MAG: hypothetical protein ACT4NX_08915 [Deltaproteobacteria bacterium]
MKNTLAPFLTLQDNQISSSSSPSRHIAAISLSILLLLSAVNSLWAADNQKNHPIALSKSENSWGGLVAKHYTKGEEAAASTPPVLASVVRRSPAAKKSEAAVDAKLFAQSAPPPPADAPKIERSESETERKPVKIEELLTEQKKITLDLSATYSHTSRSSGSTGLVSINTAGGQSIIIPVFLGDQEVDQDFISYTLNVRYGVTRKLELFGFGSVLTSFQRAFLNGQRDSDSDFNFNFAGLGATYQVRREDNYPALLVSASTNVLDNTEFTNDDYQLDYFRTFSASLTSFYTVDPVIFFAQASYRQSLKREHRGISIDPGEVFSFSPQVLFVVNPYITLTGGVRFSIQGRDKINGDRVALTRTSISPLFGVSYGIRDNLILSVDAEYRNEASFNQAILGIRATYRF